MKDKRKLFLFIIFLIIINAIILVINGCTGRRFIEYTILFIIEILATMHIMKEKM